MTSRDPSKTNRVARVKVYSGENKRRKLQNICERCLELEIPQVIEDGNRQRFSSRKAAEYSERAVQRGILDQANGLTRKRACRFCSGFSGESIRFQLRPTKVYWPDGSPAEIAELEKSLTYTQGQVLSEGEFKSVESPLAFTARTIDSHPDGKSCFKYEMGKVDNKLITTWLHRCRKTHRLCDRTKPRFSTHVKVVDVNCRQVVMLPDGSDYVALSYVWGGIPTNSSGLVGVLPKELPRTIEDALTVTKQIGQKYLWVDALCIKQDDPDERQEQIRMMDVIFGSAFATFIVISGTNSNHGIPGVSKTPMKAPIEISFGPITLNAFIGLEQEIKKSVWNTRGWTFQEGFLSKRRIIFADYHVYFYCNHSACSDTLRQDRAVAIKSDLVFKHAIELNRTTSLDAYSSEMLLKKLVNDYVSRQLTDQGDAMIAASGLITTLEKHHYPDGFFYGLPKEDFCYYFLWCCGSGIPRSSLRTNHMSRRGIHILPTWSWFGWEISSPPSATLYIHQPDSFSDPPPIVIFYNNQEIFKPEIFKPKAKGQRFTRGVLKFWERNKGKSLGRGPTEFSLQITGIILTVPPLGSSGEVNRLAYLGQDEGFVVDSDWASKFKRPRYDRFPLYTMKRGRDKLPPDQTTAQDFLVVGISWRYHALDFLPLNKCQHLDNYYECDKNPYLRLRLDDRMLKELIKAGYACYKQFWLG